MESEIPKLILFLYGEGCTDKPWQQDERLCRWATAFEAWLEDLHQHFEHSRHDIAKGAWQRLLRQQQKPPWELEPADIQRHMHWMQAESFAAITVANSLWMFKNFFAWCGEHHVDPACPPGFNPAQGIQRPSVKLYTHTTLLSRGEAELLLKVMSQDQSPLGKRDYAFTLARLKLGVPLRQLLGLRWEQLQVDAQGASVRWRADAEPLRLPDQVWQAFHSYLLASGRLDSMEPGKYLFAPLSNPKRVPPWDRQEDWAEHRHLSDSQALRAVKLYGKVVGIPDDKLTLAVLHTTALRLRMDEGATSDEMWAFMGGLERKSSAKYRLKKLPPLPVEVPPPAESLPPGLLPAQPSSGTAEVSLDNVTLPNRQAKLFQPWQGMTHGMFAHRQPPEEVKEVLREHVQGVDEEIACLRTLGRSLMHRQEQAGTRKELADLMAAYIRSAYWLGELIRIEEEIKAREEQANPDEATLEGLRRASDEMILGAVDAQEFRRQALGNPEEMDESARRLVEEIASTRLVLRRTFFLAQGAEQTAELVRLTDLYGTGCVRLVRLLKMEGSEASKLKEFMLDKVFESIDRMWQELGEPPKKRDWRKLRRMKKR